MLLQTMHHADPTSFAPAPAADLTAAAQHVYIHVPFCSGKCLYCGFYSVRWEKETANRWIEALRHEIEKTLPGRATPRTIYMGGGTPSLLDEAQCAALCGHIRTLFDLRDLEEWTWEANPGTLSPEKLRVLREAGATRLSLGAQSFDDRILTFLGRRHSAADIRQSVAMARGNGFGQISLDLIAGVPGVDGRAWDAALQAALELEPDHLSVYALSVEEGSQLKARLDAGALALPDDEAAEEAILQAEAALARAGFARYEISNYALPGHECRHNLAFWRGGDFLGFGPAAASRAGRHRWANAANLDGYCAAAEQGLPPPREQELLAPAQDSGERFVFAFRLLEGVAMDDFCRRHRVPAAQRRQWEAQLERRAAQGLAERQGARWRLTPQGRAMADALAGELLPAAGF
jgi:oxygen-independent coproporphyrinogen-3 oxidase